MKEVTTRASERITKTFSIRTRSLDETTTTNTTRRVIQNTGDRPVNYGLRRVLRKVHVKVQNLGPRLVWQLYVRSPGEGLARGGIHDLDLLVGKIPTDGFGAALQAVVPGCQVSER